MAREPDFDAWLDRRTNDYLDKIFGDSDDDEEAEDDDDPEGGQADETEAPQGGP